MKQMETENAKLKIMKQKKKKEKKKKNCMGALMQMLYSDYCSWNLLYFVALIMKLKKKEMDKIYETAVGRYLTVRKMVFLLEIHKG